MSLSAYIETNTAAGYYYNQLHKIHIKKMHANNIAKLQIGSLHSFLSFNVENGFKMNRVLIKVKVSMNLYLHIVNFEIERYITIMVPMLSIK